jgi:hypothetical protein
VTGAGVPISAGSTPPSPYPVPVVSCRRTSLARLK